MLEVALLEMCGWVDLGGEPGSRCVVWWGLWFSICCSSEDRLIV